MNSQAEEIEDSSSESDNDVTYEPPRSAPDKPPYRFVERVVGEFSSAAVQAKVLFTTLLFFPIFPIQFSRTKFACMLQVQALARARTCDRGQCAFEHDQHSMAKTDQRNDKPRK